MKKTRRGAVATRRYKYESNLR